MFYSEYFEFIVSNWKNVFQIDFKHNSVSDGFIGGRFQYTNKTKSGLSFYFSYENMRQCMYSI